MKQLNARVLLALLFVANSISAQSVWTGGGADDNWNTPSNWGSAPVAGANLQFGGTTRLNPVNNFATDTLFNSITFDAGAGAFNLTGNRIRLGGSIINNDDSPQSIGLELALTGTRTITGGTAGITLNGAVSQSGGTYGLNTNGFITLTAGNTYGGTTTINAGTLALTGSGAISDSSPVNLAQSGSIFDISGISGTSETVASLAGVAGSSVILGGKTLSVGGGTTFSGSMSGTGGSFTKTGADTLILSSATWTQTGTSTVSAGTLQLTNSSITGGTLNNSATGTIRAVGTSTIGGIVTNASGGQISIGGGNTLQLQGSSTYTNDGNIALTPSSSFGAYIRLLGDVNLTGAGTVTMTKNGGSDSFFAAYTGAEYRLTNGVSHTIQGSGRLGNNETALTNHGTIHSNNVGGVLIIDPTATGAINSATGVMRSASGAFLTFQDGSLSNAGLVESLGTLTLSSALVTGGTVQTSGAGILVLNNSTFTSGNLNNSATGTFTILGTSTIGGTVANAAGGQVNIGSGNNLQLQGSSTYTNNGNIAISPGSSSSSYIRLLGDVTLAGTGTVTMTRGGGDSFLAAYTGAEYRLTNGVSHTIQGAGRLGNNETALTNHGTILANNVGGVLIVDPIATGAINSATGVMRSASGAFLTFQDGSLTNEGLVEAATGGTLNFTTAFITNTTGDIRSASGTLNLTSTTVSGGTVELTGNGNLNLTTSTISDGELVNMGTGSITVSGGSSGSSSTISSLINLSGSNSLTASSSRTLHVNGGISKDATTTTFSGGGTINVSGTGISGASSNSNIVLLGPSLNLTAANTYGGSTTLSGGTMTVSGAGTLPDTTAVSFTSSSTLNLSGITASSETIGSLAGTTGSVILGGKNLTTGGNDTSSTFAGAISGTLGSLTKTGTGTMILSGSNSYTGVTTFAAGTLSVATIGNGGVAGNLGQAAIAAANLVFDGGALQYTGTNAGTNRNFTINAGKTAVFDITTNNLTLNGASAATTGALTKIGAGTLTLAVAQAHTGLTTVNAGTLVYGVSNALSTGGVTVDGAGAVLNLGTFSDTVGAVIVDNGGTISGTGTLTSTVGFDVRNGTISAPTSGAVGVSKNSIGTVLASVASSYTGATTINNGTLEVTANNALGSNASGTTVGDGATLKLTGVNYATTESVTLNGSGFSGGGALRNSGTSSFAGPISANTNASIHAGGGTLTLTGGLAKNGTTLTLTGGGTINVNNVGISGASANSDLVVDGTTANLNTSNTYNGPTFVRNGGTLNANVVNALPSSPRTHVVMDDTGVGNSTLSLGASQSIASLSGAASSTVNLASHDLTTGSATGDGVFSGSISGTGSLLKEGANSQTLAGPSTYSGGTLVSAGTLNITNTTGSATGSGEVVVDASATLSGTGRIEAAINTNFEINGILTVGDSTLSSPVASSFTLTTSGTGEVSLGSVSEVHFDLFSGAGAGDNTALTGSADHIRLFGRLDTSFDALIVIGNPNSMSTFAYGDQWRLFDLAGGLITESSSFVLDVNSLGLAPQLVASFDASTGVLSIIPEPSRLVLFLIGLGVFGLKRRRKI